VSDGIVVILRIRIQQWRAYRDATIELGHALVFFVAPNGVGKSSLCEAARRCLYGFPTGRGAGSPVRAGSDRAMLSVDIRLPDGTEVTVTRTLTRAGRATFAANHAGDKLNEDEFLSLLERSWSADPALQDRLMFGDLSAAARAKAALPIREHLADLLGVTPLLEAAASLREAQATARTTIAGLRADVAVTVEAVALAQQSLDDAQRQLDRAVTERDTLQPLLLAAEHAATAATTWESYRANVANYNEQVQRLLAEIGDLIRVDAETPADALDLVRRVAEQGLAQARTTVNDAALVATRAATAADLLSESLTVCPTCLRPLADHERLDALHSHGSTTRAASSDTERARAQISDSEQRLKVVAEFARRLDRLHQPTTPTVDDPGPSAIQELTDLRARENHAAEQLGEARANRHSAASALEAARASSDDLASLELAGREELLTETTATILQAVADRYLSERIEPLTHDIANRWKLLFGTEGLVLDPAGAIRLRHGDVELDLDDMSGGERAVAGIVVRVLVAASATRIPSLWFDEPLEHLDPRRRGAIAQTLVQAVNSGSIKQVVVTTYEEAIARRLAAGAPHLVTVVHADADRNQSNDIHEP
jgi:DNA repair exonuclease SbcCD ATPase subunit